MSLGQWSACGATGLLIAASLTAYGMYNDALSIDTEEVDPDGWGDRPPEVEGLHNILLLGTDERAGDEAGFSEENGVRPDVLVIVSIDADNGGVTMVNLPRDLIVELPACDAVGDYPGSAGGSDQLNHAMFYGGMDCQGNAVETVTGVHLEHIVAVDFAGFEEIVDTIGGVEMCVPEPVDDPKADLTLEAGEQRLSGEQALGLARSRASTEFGSDLNRIENQQRLMGAIMREVTSGDLLSSPTTLYGFIDAVTDSLVTDDDLNVDRMRELAIAVREVDLEQMNMVTVPVLEHPADENKLTFDDPAARELFAAVAAGEVLAEEEAEESEEEAEEPVEPSDVSVRILNGTVTDGLAAQVEPLLAQEGFTVTGTGNPQARVPEATTVYHGPGQEAEAELLASALTSATTEEVPDLEGDALELVMAQADWGPVIGLGGGSDGADGTGDGDGGALDGLDTSTAAEDEVTCG
ncbi:LCP family protein [Nocardiopsis sp. NRRL B-16309]|uniref:LCP family protein n=1 Tax=Nocardiopsis sp. NRRL B-16309 TaxID=1519494 RepID=UPI000A9AEB79|nr:LCP family protein [Nocardiopsis sp. NRRL B-16309]